MLPGMFTLVLLAACLVFVLQMATSTEPQVPSSRFGSALQYFNSYDPSVLLPGNATVQTCYLIVPFDHYIRSARVGATDIDNVGTVGAQIMAAAPGGAKAGVLVGTALTDTDLAATADVTSNLPITLAAADTGTLRVAGTTYHLQISGTNAGDLVEQPHMTIGVEPADRSRL